MTRKIGNTSRSSSQARSDPAIPPVEYLDQATARIDTAIARANREIDLIRECRTRLIADVVTGKLDVRGYNVVKESDDTAPPGG